MPQTKMKVSELEYLLPEDRIALYPVNPRDQSRLLVYSQKDQILHTRFSELLHFVPTQSQWIFNVTQVIQARLFFKKPTGGSVEVFLLSPLMPVTDPSLALQATSNETVWLTLIRGKNVHPGLTLTHDLGLEALVGASHQGQTQVRFSWPNSWQDKKTFGEILEVAGKIPLPPYIHREVEPLDKTHYQTLYAVTPGSVAAPTAGLHFTDQFFKQLAQRQDSQIKGLLHIGAGTFKPLQGESVLDHVMHEETLFVTEEQVLELLEFEKKREQGLPRLAVGTTSLRWLESLYWVGVTGFWMVPQWGWKNVEPLPARMAFSKLLDLIKKSGSFKKEFSTRLMITQGYPFKTCEGLITNFHQPKSSLLALVDAWVGLEERKKIYEFALQNQYRFLSYGDGSLLWKNGGLF